MSTEENKAIVRRFIEEFWGQGKLAVADELAVADYLAHGSDFERTDTLEAAKQSIAQVHTEHPSSSAFIEDIFAEGDKVVARVAAQGVEEPWTVISIFRLADSKIVEEWSLAGKPWD